MAEASHAENQSISNYKEALPSTEKPKWLTEVTPIIEEYIDTGHFPDHLDAAWFDREVCGAELPFAGAGGRRPAPASAPGGEAGREAALAELQKAKDRLEEESNCTCAEISSQ